VIEINGGVAVGLKAPNSPYGSSISRATERGRGRGDESEKEQRRRRKGSLARGAILYACIALCA